MDFRPVVLVNGLLLVVLAVAMAIPAAVDLASANPDWIVFVMSGAVTLFVGVAMALTSYSRDFRFTVRQGFVITTSAWVVNASFAALPFMFSELRMTFTDGFFEAMSGLTTTGATVITGLDKLPPGILLWRGLLQWIGGIGIIVMAIAILPILRVGGMQLFRMESSDRSEKAFPRAAQVASAIGTIYLGMTVFLILAFWGAGMRPFEAVVHAMTTISTGGFSTSDSSIGVFDSPWIDGVVMLGMLSGSLPFILFLKTLRGDRKALVRDSQVRAYLGLVVLAVTAVTGWLWLHGGMELLQAVRFASFNVVSVVSGTGYATTDFGLWGSFATAVLFFLMFAGGCTGSASGGIKMYRLLILYAAARTQIHYLFQPHGVFIPYFNRRPVPDEVITSVLAFFYIYMLVFALLTVACTAAGLDVITALSGVATAMGNVGPGFGTVIGPAGTFQPLPDAAKWLLALGMFLGRLELFTIIVLFSRAFWRA
ncbi:MAG: TrkH family potassium uptake protein [Magnetospirillum sp. WYHS-4]